MVGSDDLLNPEVLSLFLLYVSFVVVVVLKDVP